MSGRLLMTVEPGTRSSFGLPRIQTCSPADYAGESLRRHTGAFQFKGLFPDMPAGQPARTSFHASAAVKRGDFGMTRDNLMELEPNSKGPDVAIEIDLEADASAPAK